MVFVRVAQEQQQSITIQFVSFRAILALTQLVRHQEDVSQTEPGVAKISFAKVKQITKQNYKQSSLTLQGVVNYNPL